MTAPVGLLGTLIARLTRYAVRLDVAEGEPQAVMHESSAGHWVRLDNLAEAAIATLPQQELATQLRAALDECLLTSGGSLFPKAKAAFEDLLAALPPAQGWHPIETAPKDGRDILVLHPDHSICISYWGCIRGRYGLKSKLHTSVSGGEGDFCRDAIGWMPLPAPPVAAKETP